MMTFIYETRKKHQQGGLGGCQQQQHWRQSGCKNTLLGSNLSGWRKATCFYFVFCLRLAVMLTGLCACIQACKCLCACAHCCGAHPSRLSRDAGVCGRRPSWLIKRQPAALKQYQLHDKRREDQSTTQSNEGENKRQREKKLSVEEQRYRVVEKKGQIREFISFLWTNIYVIKDYS